MITKEELLSVAEKAFNVIVTELRDDERINPVDFMCVLAILHRIAFANVEREAGIDEARKTCNCLMDLINETLKEGAWDEESGMMK